MHEFSVFQFACRLSFPLTCALSGLYKSIFSRFHPPHHRGPKNTFLRLGEKQNFTRSWRLHTLFTPFYEAEILALAAKLKVRFDSKQQLQARTRAFRGTKLLITFVRLSLDQCVSLTRGQLITLHFHVTNKEVMSSIFIMKHFTKTVNKMWIFMVLINKYFG